MSDNSRLAKNTILLYIRMLAQMALSLYTSRIILQNLGIVDFGLYNVVGGVVLTFVFLNSAMNSSTQRYLTIAIGKGNAEELHKVFNISRVIHTGIGLLIVLLCEIFGIWFISNKMVIPDGREYAVHWAFQFSMLSVFISTITIPYNALLIAREKMGAFAYFTILEVFFQFVVAYSLSIINGDRLIYYALLLAVFGIIVRLIYGTYCNKRFPECSFRFFRSDPLYKEMTVFAAWGLLGHFSNVINSSIQNMMLNVFFSPVINAARGIALKVSDAIMRFNENFQMAVSPQITKKCALGEKEKMFSLIYNSSRFSIYLMWLLSLPVIMCMDDILHLWLVEVPDYTSIFLKLVLIDNMITSIANPLNMAIRANGKIKYPELFGGIILILNLPISYFCLKIGCQPESVFLVMILCDIFCQISRILFSNHYLQMPIVVYLKNVLLYPIIIVLMSFAGPFFLLNAVHIDNSLLRLVVVGGGSIISVLLNVYLFGINKSERIYINSLVKKYL